MSTCNLKECFLNADMDRLDHPEYFQSKFQCTQLDQFFTQFRKTQKIFSISNKKLLNLFFDRLISKHKAQNNIYIRLKWLVFFHQHLSALPDCSPLFPYSQKALAFFSEAVEKQSTLYGPYQKYLCKLILKPYIQYISKLCILKSSDSENTNKQNITLTSTKWYQTYNFVMTASQTFSTSLKEAKNYFAESFPYLNRISLNITTDIRQQMHYIKEVYKKDTSSKISAFEIEEMQDKINSFIWQNSFELKESDMKIEFIDTEIEGCNKEQVTEFMSSGAKPREYEFQVTVPSFDMH